MRLLERGGAPKTKVQYHMIRIVGRGSKYGFSRFRFSMDLFFFFFLQVSIVDQANRLDRRKKRTMQSK